MPGKKARLIGNGSISGANRKSKICEKIRLSSLDSLQRFVRRIPEGQQYVAFSFDIRGAHKLVKVRESEQGFSIFVFEDSWFAYQSVCFGCRWAAYWFSRVSSFLVRHLHRYIFIAHGLFCYVDDGLILIPAQIAPLVGCTSLMFLISLGVPISWEKLTLGSSLTWLGWDFQRSTFSAYLPESKREKPLCFLNHLLLPGKSVERKLIEQCVGLLLWFCGGAYWLKPWLQPFYKLCTSLIVPFGPCHWDILVHCCNAFHLHYGLLLQFLNVIFWLAGSYILWAITVLLTWTHRL